MVADSTPLPVIHRIMQAACGWKDQHLHEFRVATVRFGAPEDGSAPPAIDEGGVGLYQLVLDEGDRFTYRYDFGDDWELLCLLEDVRAADEPTGPQCLDGERGTPPEDCGGIPGYERLVAALSDPRDSEHLELRRWVGNWDPEHVDLGGINRRLARLPVSSMRLG